MTPSLRRTAVALAASSLLLSGCSFRGAASFPLPGGVGGDGYQVKVEFSDVLDLVPQSSVRVNDVAVGSVKDIELSRGGYTAIVTISVKRDVVLPENVTAALRQTSLLGEKFVSLEAPDRPEGRLKDGMFIPLDRTQRNADIEEVLGALSLVLNGGSLEQLQVINSELTKALKGRESQVHDFLRQLSGFIGGLDEQKGSIVAALDGLDRLSSKLAAQRGTLDVALRDIPKGTRVLADERAQLTRMLAGLRELGTVATRVIQASQQATIADLKALRPILSQLVAAGDDFPQALDILLTYPFPRTVASPTGRGGMRGDYANLFITIDSSLQNAIENLTGVPLPVPLPTLAPTGPGSRGSNGSSRGGAGATPAPVPTDPDLPVETDDLLELDNDLVRLLLGGLA
jgi:phospholipid/cholesterol/gamma-HCH transport system substrate-binding protein